MPAHEVQAPRPLAPAGIDSALVHSPSMRHLAIAALALVSAACAPKVAPATDPVPPQLPVVESTAAEPTFADGFESGSTDQWASGTEQPAAEGAESTEAATPAEPPADTPQ